MVSPVGRQRRCPVPVSPTETHGHVSAYPSCARGAEAAVGLTLTILFEDPFWVGVFERTSPGTFEIARVVFGDEPSDAAVWAFVRDRFDWASLARVETAAGQRPSPRHTNPKRRQREAAAAVTRRGMSTRSQLALQAAREETRQVGRQERRRAKSEEAERRFALRQARKKERRRGH
jgi:hypothetical protein